MAVRHLGLVLALWSAFAALPAAAAPAHVRDFTYYGLNDINAGIPAAWMAQHMDIVEDDGFTAEHADAFKRAGGKTALAYTDPTYVPHCSPPFRPPAGECKGPIGRYLNNDEGGWMHDAGGERVRRRFEDPQFGYQEVLAVGSAPARRAYARETAGVLAHSPLLDGFVADDSGSPFTGRDPRPGSNLYDGFDNRGVEIRDDAQWILDETAMLAAAGKPVLINGGDPQTWGAAYSGRFVELSYVLGQEFEGCFVNGDSGPYTDTDRRFEREADGLRDVTRRRKLALCLPTGPTDPAHRTYAYASWLLTYDPQYSVYGMNVKQSDGYSVVPEVSLVPGRARSTGPIESLRHGSMYAREFESCAIAGREIGPCAAVVNPSHGSAPVPALETRYAHHVALDARSAFTGGRAAVVQGAPTSLGPVEAAILVR